MSRQRLKPDKYKQVRLQVLARDRWQCQLCGKSTNLEVHHQHSRAQGGKDQLENLISLCSDCHQQLHANPENFD
jgi:5-methylcytosine-specific restriction endonuclease McrA